MTYKKDWWLSRTVWVNLLAFAAFMTQAVTGQDLLNIETQAVIIAVLNIILRFQTSDPIR
jgi:hypothetical protein